MSPDRLITQFEITTSTASSGQRDRLDRPLQELDVLDARLPLVVAGELEHLVGHVEAEGLAGRADAARGQEHVDPAAGAEVEHGLSRVQIGDRRWVAAPERSEPGGVGQGVAIGGLVEIRSEDVALLGGDHRGVGLPQQLASRSPAAAVAAAA